MVVSKHQDAALELARLFEEHCNLRLPKFGRQVRGLHGADVDLFEEDAYLVGLADSFLGRRLRGTGRMKVETILLDPTIDDRLQCQKLRLEKDRETLEQFKRYRESMVCLAHALGRATGVPVQFRDAEWRAFALERTASQ